MQLSATKKIENGIESFYDNELLLAMIIRADYEAEGISFFTQDNFSQQLAYMKRPQEYNIALIEDAAEAHGATYKGIKVGALSHIATFSFFANKNLTTGEGGMLVTNDDELAKACRYYKNMCFALDAPRTYFA